MNETVKSPEGKGLRIRAFANFFKSYMSVSTVVAAAIPIPIASWKLIPIYAQQKTFLTVYASLFCFLLLAFVFSIRHWLCPHLFGRTPWSAVIGALPVLFIALTVGCILAYHATLLASFEPWRERGVNAKASALLETTDFSEISYALTLAATYLGIFVFAEAAFVLMAIREYLQDVLHLDEVKLLRGQAGFSEPDAIPIGQEVRGLPPRL
jgi:hypothetical protein